MSQDISSLNEFQTSIIPAPIAINNMMSLHDG
jgi:hypothetical protein